MALLLSAVAVLVPLIITPGLLFYFDVSPKVAVLLIGTAAATLIIALHQSDQTSAWPNTLRYFAALLVIQGIVLVAATAVSTHWQLSLMGTNWRRFGLVPQLAILVFTFLLCLTLSGHPVRRLLLLRSVALGGVVAAAYGILQYFSVDPWLASSGYTIGEGEWAIIRPPSTLGHASYAATYCLLVVFSGVALAWTESTRLWRTIGLIAAGLGSVAIVLSGTRAAILGLVTGGLLLVIARRPRFTPRRAVGCMIVIACFAAFYVSPAGQKLRGRVRWSGEDATGGARLLLWRDSLRMAAARPVLGWGIETYSTEFPRFQSRDLARAYPDFYYESPHNIFLDAFVSTGVLGLVGLLAASGLGLVCAWLARKTASAEALILAAGLIGSLVAQQFTAFTVATALYLYAAIAVLVSLTVNSQPVVRWPWMFPVLGIAFLVFAVRLIVADSILARTNAALQRGDLEKAVEFHSDSRRWQAPSPYSDLWYSRALAQQAAMTQEGYIAAERATVTAEDRHNAFYNLAMYRALQNDLPSVEANLREAICWAPNWFKPHWTLAKSLKVAGRVNEAEKEFAIALDLDAGVHAEVQEDASR